MRRPTPLDSRALPPSIEPRLRGALGRAHGEEPFSPADVRATAQRVAAIVEDLGCTVATWRGALDLQGAEVDHVWLAVRDGHGEDGDGPWVLDVAFPLFHAPFVEALRSWVSTGGPAESLVEAARSAPLGLRVLGRYPARMRYLGAPIWSAR